MIIRNESDFQQALTWLQSQEKVAYDIETNGVNKLTNTIIGIGISNSTRGYYLPIYSYDAITASLVPTDVGHLASKFVQALAAKQLICFNGAFDLPFTKQIYGLDLVPNLHTDVLLLKHTVDEEYPFKLKEIATQVFGYGAAQEQRDLQAEVKAAGGAKHDLYVASPETIGKYCVQDCLLTYRLYNHYLRLLNEQGLQKFFYEDEVMPLYREVTIPMENYGIKLDIPLMQQMHANIVKDIKALETNILQQIEPLLEKFYKWFLNKDYPPSRSGNFAQGIAEYAGLDLPRTALGKYSLTAANIAKLPDSHFKQVLLKKEMLTDHEILGIQQLLAKKDHGNAPLFNLQSKHHLKKLFFDTLGLTPLSTTDLGNPQVDDNFIHSIADQYEWANDLHVYNKLQKIKATYIERFLEGQIDGIYYPSFFQHRTVSGRLSGDFQQLPRSLDSGADDERVVKYTNAIRQFFIARENCVFVDADYNSAEPRVFAYISGDENLKNIFKNGYDFYSEIAIRTEGLKDVSSLKKADNYLGKVNPTKRQSSKAYALGVPYGLQGYKLSYQLNCTPEEGERLVNNYLNAFPKLKEWMQHTQATVLECGYIRTIGGRIRHLPRAVEYHQKYGLSILDPLQLYKEYGSDERIYQYMKKIRKELKNYINNGSNVQIQSTVASIINKASIRIARELKQKNIKAQIVGQIHDQLITECLIKDKELVAEIIQRHMESSAKELVPDVPIPAEPNFGHNLKESKGA